MSRKIYAAKKFRNIDLRDYYKKANEWLSDLDFLDGELNFFQKILRLHFSDPADVTALQADEVERQLSRLEMNWQLTRAEAVNHREVLDLLMKDLVSYEEEFVRNQHEALQVKIIGLEQSFKMFKADFFRKTEMVPDSRSPERNTE